MKPYVVLIAIRLNTPLIFLPVVADNETSAGQVAVQQCLEEGHGEATIVDIFGQARIDQLNNMYQIAVAAEAS